MTARNRASTDAPVIDPDGGLPGPRATTADEVPVFLHAGEDHLFGVVTRPTVESNGVGVVVVGGREVPCTHRNGVFVRLGRRLAAGGFTTIRVDYRGVGDSSGEIKVWDLETPFVRDLLAAVDWLKVDGAKEIVLVGDCFGGRTALWAADRVPDLKGLALLATPVETHPGASQSLAWHIQQALRPRTLRRMFRPAWRKKYVRMVKSFFRGRSGASDNGTGGERVHVSAHYVASLSGVVDRRVPILIAFGEEGKHYKPFEAARKGQLGDVLDRAEGRLTLAIGEGELHGMLTLEAQAFGLQTVERWIESL